MPVSAWGIRSAATSWRRRVAVAVLILVSLLAAAPALADSSTGPSPGDVGSLGVALGAWRPLGPGNIGGRTRSLVIHPTSPSIMYAGAVGGGVWKTDNAGGSWRPLSDLAANLTVSALAMDPHSPSVLYAGTGEGYFNTGAVRGDGIFKSTNSGSTWTQLASTNDVAAFFYVNKIVVSPGNGQRVYAATRAGVMRSLDGGTTWTRVLAANAVNGCTDLVIRTDTAADYVFAACGTLAPASIYRNRNAGGAGTWEKVLSQPGMGRTSLALAPSSQSVVYALSASIAPGTFEGGLHAVFRSTMNGAAGTWVRRVDTTSTSKLHRLLLSDPLLASAARCLGQADTYVNHGWYANAIAVDPTDPDVVWAGGVDLLRSVDGGATWRLASFASLAPSDPQYVHADQHAIVFHPQYNGATNQQLFVANDGGVFRTANARSGTVSADACAVTQGSIAWTELNNSYAVTQFNHGLPYPSGTTYVGGTQGNGTLRGTDAAGANGWVRIHGGGDGGYVAIDPTNPATLYVGETDGRLVKSTNGGTTFQPAVTGLDDPAFLEIAPLVMDPTNPERLWTGGEFMWRSDNGAGVWTRASASLCGAGSASAIAVAPSARDRVYAGMSDGCVNRTTIGTTATGTSAWASSLPRPGFVSSLAVHPTNPGVVYATYAALGGARVWRSVDGGVSWTSIDGSGPTRVPDVPVHAISIDPTDTTRLYVGTAVGVFASRDGGVTWAVENTGFANVTTRALAPGTIDTTRYLYAFTQGRGAWRTPTAHQLAVTRSGIGSGTVTSTPAGISCGSTCAAFFTVGRSVTLTAAPASGSKFTGWSGACSGASSSCTVTISAAKSVTATFQKLAQVRFLNNTVFQQQPYTATLRTRQGYQWSSFTGAPSAYRSVTAPFLDQLVVDVPGQSIPFQGSFTITPGRKYRITFFVDSAGATRFGITDEGAVADAFGPPDEPAEALAPLSDGAGRDGLQPAPSR